VEGKEITDLDNAVAGYIKYLEDRGYSAATQNKQITGLKHRLQALFELSPYKNNIVRLYELERKLHQLPMKKINSAAP